MLTVLYLTLLLSTPAAATDIIDLILTEKSAERQVLELRMPNVTTKHDNEYLVTPIHVTYDDAYIVGYEPRANSSTAHHVLIYGCTEPARTSVKYWNVGDMGGHCGNRGIDTILWAWALDATQFVVPQGIGFHVGKNANINYIILEIHYKHPISTPDTSGVDVILTTTAPPNLAGIYLFATGGTVIEPGKVAHGDTTCNYNSPETITPFAFRTHTHKLGRRVSAWRQRGDTWTLIGTGDPRKPQMFYLIEGAPTVIEKGDVLHARCVFDGSATSHTVYIGATGADEMCNFYMMYYMNNTNFKLREGCFYEKSFVVPAEARVATKSDKPQNGELIPGFTLDKNWTSALLGGMGQVGGLSHSARSLVVFHRGPNDWSAKRWFDNDNVVLVKDSLIQEDTIIFIDPDTGKIERSLGSGMFVLPHGVYLDHQDNVYVTDVALHQVIKFDANRTEPSLVLGEKWVPGSDAQHFCKPTNVAVDLHGNIYVSDGYCNSRVVKFTAEGKYVGSFGKQSFVKGVAGGLNLVHDLTINQEEEVVYVADRENGQIHVMLYNGSFTKVYSQPEYGNVYSVDYSPALGSIIAVNITSHTQPAKVMILDSKSGKILKTYPKDNVLNLPHAVTYVKNNSIFVGEISKPFKIWRISRVNLRSLVRVPPTFLHILTDNIPTSFIILIIVLGLIPIGYLIVVVIFRYSQNNGSKYDKNGFQKLLRDYDSSDEEEDLVFKNSQVFR